MNTLYMNKVEIEKFTKQLIDRGYDIAAVKSGQNRLNVTYYYIRQDNDYVFAVSLLEDDQVLPMIVSKDILKQLKLLPDEGYKGKIITVFNDLPCFYTNCRQKRPIARGLVGKNVRTYFSAYKLPNILDLTCFWTLDDRKAGYSFPTSNTYHAISKVDDKYMLNSSIRVYDNLIQTRIIQAGFNYTCKNSATSYYDIKGVYDCEESAYEALARLQRILYGDIKTNLIAKMLDKNFELAFRYYMLNDISYEALHEKALAKASAVEKILYK